MNYRWTGYWEQRGMGRQPMEDLVLQIDGGAIHGQGRDIIGRFTLAGRMEADGRVTIDKQYIDQHAVLYQGQYDGEGTIFGQWSIGLIDRGDFLIRVCRPAQNLASETQIEEISSH